MTVRRRRAAGTATLTALALLLGGCAGPAGEDADDGRSSQSSDDEAPRVKPRLLGDGSTAVTGRQPGRHVPSRLAPGAKPPQFVVFSWDGAGEDGNRLFSRFRKLAKEYDASMTYFLSGIYLLPEEERARYHPPGHSVGASDIGYLDDEDIRATLEQLRLAWLDGSEVGTHFNGHFCGPGGVGSWSVQEWKSEIRQSKYFVQHWKTTTGWKGMPPLPFDYDKELIGGRTPCLEGRDNLLPAARDMGFRYDSSGNGTQVWPGKEEGLWDLPLQQIPMPGRSFETLSMDYNFLANQSGTVKGDPAKRAYWERQWHDGLLQGFRRAYEGNRAPMIIGNHFEQWNGGIYMDGLAEVIKTVCSLEDVRCVSFRQLVDWLDVQDPRVLAKLRTLGVGEKPKGGWEQFLAGKAARSVAPSAAAPPAAPDAR
ncbi:hypothetical protein E4198_11365 [Streptomyces sp. RKND-216]|uniref:hypothetical protein n=1 Tax=Streptomyces sp. RKND-216 TaxID=2562581 RepID=UPI00109D982F|nr:hypothetical protein [Streptomyces sp. RKND-216]THA25245.1 hypothetical protein E4198_11365 [Streptomyces sp. RKND-216]